MKDKIMEYRTMGQDAGGDHGPRDRETTMAGNREVGSGRGIFEVFHRFGWPGGYLRLFNVI